MRLPWVSRLAYELVLDERNRLRAQNDSLVDALGRIGRAKSGLPESVRPAPEPQAQRPVELPDSIEVLIQGFASEAIRDSLREQARMLYAAGNPWSSIEASIAISLDSDSEGELDG